MPHVFCVLLLTDVFPSWKYVPTVVGDGNFKQDHLKMKNPEEDVALSDGEGYMVGKKDFEEYLKLTDSAPDVTTSVCLAQLSITRLLLTYLIGFGMQ